MKRGWAGSASGSIWTSRKRGGTADTIRHAAMRGVPTWWLPAEGEGVPRVIRDSADFAGRGTLPEGPAAWAFLGVFRGRR